MSENLLQQILSEMKGFKDELTHLRTDMETQGKTLGAEMNEQVGGLRAEMNERFDRVDAELSVLKGGQQGVRSEITDRFREVFVKQTNI